MTSLSVLAEMVARMLSTDVLTEVSINVVVSPVDMVSVRDAELWELNGVEENTGVACVNYSLRAVFEVFFRDSPKELQDIKINTPFLDCVCCNLSIESES